MEGLMVLFGLALAGIAFLLPIVSFLLALGNQRRLRALEETVIRLQGQLNARPAPTTSVRAHRFPFPRGSPARRSRRLPAPAEPSAAGRSGAAPFAARATGAGVARCRSGQRAIRACGVGDPRAAQAAHSARAAACAARAAERRRRLRLGEPGRRPTLLGRGGHRPRLRRDLLPALLDRARLAAAARARRDRRPDRRGAARRLRAPRRAALSDHGQCARRGRGLHPLRHLLRRPCPVAADSGLAHVPAARARGRGGRAALDPARVDLHRRPRAAGRLLDAGAAVDGGEPADSAVRLPAAAQPRPRVGGARARVARSHRPEPRAHHALPVGVGRSSSSTRRR